MPPTRPLHPGRRWLAVALTAAVAACASVQDRVERAHDIAREAGMRPRVVDGGPFALQTFRRAGRDADTLRVYIEGDGFAWVNRHRPSSDPTPRTPVALRLAARDPAPGVLYVARPCQYLGGVERAGCDRRDWTTHRFAPAVIEATDTVIDKVKRRTGARRVALVGFSGGGAVAPLVAARRDDVASLRTVAGTLDHVVLNRHHDVSPLTGSLNAADVAADLRDLPQVHFIGGADDIIGPFVARSYRRHAGDDRCLRTVRVPDAGHTEGWAARWPRLLKAHPPACQARGGPARR